MPISPLTLASGLGSIAAGQGMSDQLSDFANMQQQKEFMKTMDKLDAGRLQAEAVEAKKAQASMSIAGFKFLSKTADDVKQGIH